MLNNKFIEKLLELQDVNVNKIENFENEKIIHCKLKIKPHKCPVCGEMTTSIHDYREQKIKDIPAFGKNVIICLKKRRYRCKCGKRFQEENSFIPKYHRMTNRLSAYIIDQLRNEYSFTSVSKSVNLSVSTVIRVFDIVSYPKAKISDVLAIDEFKGNTGHEKYNCILTDPENGLVLDILPKRYGYYLTEYFNSFSRSDRENVKYFISDMWKTYSDTAAVWFKNATQVVDKYHWIRQVIWAFENVRKQEQKKLSKTHRKYFKHSRALLLKRFDFLSDEQKQSVNIMLYASPTLSLAHALKESFLKILECKNREEAKKSMSDWINFAYSVGIPQFEKCAQTFINWSTGILNSFSTNFTNGFTEGCNNKIKVLKRNAYGYKNFKRFRNRILHMFSYKKQVTV